MIIGRKKEIELLNQAHNSQFSEFVAVYGRRRIGKTFLVNETFENRFTFRYTGIYNLSSKDQIKEFTRHLIRQGLPEPRKAPANWFDAFSLLRDLIDMSSEKRKIIFLDELPWMDAVNSKFVQALENFWNGWASARKDILLIVCGSATSWIINKVLRSKGGLYNRVTYKIQLKPFTLYECEELVKSLRFSYNRNMILEGYMAIGGVPYYWVRQQRGKSIYQNINDLFLRTDGELHNEFKYIYASMFKNPEKYIQVVKALTGKKSGLTRDEIAEKGKLANNGQLTRILEDLTECGFIRKYCHTGKKVRDALYQLVDCFSLFHYNFINHSGNMDEDYWMKIMKTPKYHTWCGLAFERVCLLHTKQLKQALGISGMMANIFSWHIRKTETHPGVQIDLLIDRADNVIDVCEMKFAPTGYILSKSTLQDIQTKLNVLKLYMPSRKYIEPVIITSNGMKRNKYSEEIPCQVAADQFFIPN